MKLIDIIAILGALAWLPQILSWVYHWFQRPEIKVFHEEEAEVGFIKFGNAFNIRISFLAKNKHALIDNIELELEDKDGAKHNLKWVWYSETFYELQSPTGIATMAKQQNAIAINAYRDVLIEKFIGFQSMKFREAHKQLTYKLSTLIENQRKNGECDINIIKRSNEYNEMIRLYENSMIWKVGNYKAVCKIHIADTNQTISKEFGFHISDIEIDTLRKNIEYSHKGIDCEFLTPQEQLEGSWLWAKPKIHNLD